MIRGVGPQAAVALGFCLAALPALGQQAPEVPVPSITVDGEASGDVMPDMARLTMGVQLDRPTATAAAADVAKAAQAVVDQIKAEGIDPKDVQTRSVSLSPVYSDGKGPEGRTVRAYRASTDLTVIVRPAEQAGTLASHLVDKGANTIEDIEYASSQEASVLDGLRADAAKDARRKAEIYVGALGLHLGRVLEMTPGGTAEPYARHKLMRGGSAPAAAPTLPVQPGTLGLSTQVTVRWEIR